MYEVETADGEKAALKLLTRVDRNGHLLRYFDCEVATLQHLDGDTAPRLFGHGAVEDCRYVVMEWFSGITAAQSASALRQRRELDGEGRLYRLSIEILNAYTRLHVRGVVHGDVHPRNVLVGDDDATCILDFNLARVMRPGSGITSPTRGGVGFFFEPEYAHSRLVGHGPPKATFQSDQYAVAALIYFLLTGEHTVDFSAEKQKMLRQIAEAPIVAFSRRGLPPRPRLEAVLARALSKRPTDRWPSVGELAARFSEAAAMELKEGNTACGVSPALRGQMSRFVDVVLGRLGTTAPLLAEGIPSGPLCSVNYGAAGIACALYRIAQSREDPALLAQADLWAVRGYSDRSRENAFHHEELGLTEKVVGRVSPYHNESGLYAVQALIAHGMADHVSQQAALDRFLKASKAPCDNLDLTLGKAGSLLATAILYDSLAFSSLINGEPLADFGRKTAQQIWQALDILPSISEGREFTFLGIAHGWGGILYALGLWSLISGEKPAVGFEPRLQELADLGEQRGEGKRWLRKLDASRHSRYMPTWCNGAVGLIHLWVLAHRLFNEERYLELAEASSWNGWHEGDDSNSSLCCGIAGRAYGLLSLYKHTADHSWLDRAKRLAWLAVREESKSASQLAHSLYKGHLGLAVLVADLERPEMACQPFFEEEGWNSTCRT